ncbi:hypothetical protein D3C76_1688660 [compost metagenome]
MFGERFHRRDSHVIVGREKGSRQRFTRSKQLLDLFISRLFQKITLKNILFIHRQTMFFQRVLIGRVAFSTRVRIHLPTDDADLLMA